MRGGEDLFTLPTANIYPLPAPPLAVRLEKRKSEDVLQSAKGGEWYKIFIYRFYTGGKY
jgi:hypothetical protein